MRHPIPTPCLTHCPTPGAIPGPRPGCASPRRPTARSAGFTLLEIMVVVVIVGIVAASAVLAVSARGFDRELDREGRRLAALIELASEEAVLQGREMGLEFFRDSYRFHVYEPLEGRWTALDGDHQLRSRSLPEGLDLLLELEGRRAELFAAPRDAARPQVLLLSSGEVTPFALELLRPARARLHLRSDGRGRLELEREGG